MNGFGAEVKKRPAEASEEGMRNAHWLAQDRDSEKAQTSRVLPLGETVARI